MPRSARARARAAAPLRTRHRDPPRATGLRRRVRARRPARSGGRETRSRGRAGLPRAGPRGRRADRSRATASCLLHERAQEPEADRLALLRMKLTREQVILLDRRAEPLAMLGLERD